MLIGPPDSIASIMESAPAYIHRSHHSTARYGEYRPYTKLTEAGRLIDCVLSPDERAKRGLKYSCFELVDRWRTEQRPETTKAQTGIV
jgi:hypothetical protein